MVCASEGDVAPRKLSDQVLFVASLTLAAIFNNSLQAKDYISKEDPSHVKL
jgi:hypothetical protein